MHLEGGVQSVTGADRSSGELSMRNFPDLTVTRFNGLVRKAQFKHVSDLRVF